MLELIRASVSDLFIVDLDEHVFYVVEDDLFYVSYNYCIYLAQVEQSFWFAHILRRGVILGP